MIKSFINYDTYLCLSATNTKANLQQSLTTKEQYFNSMALQFQYALTFEEEADFCGEYKTQIRTFSALH